MNAQQTWETSLRQTGASKHPSWLVTIPMPIARALVEAGYNRFVVTITDTGILLTPFAAPTQDNNRRVPAVQLPSEWSA